LILTLSLGFSDSIADCAAFIATANFFSPDDRYVVSIDCDLSIMTMMSFGFVAAKLYHGLHSSSIQRRFSNCIITNELHRRIEKREIIYVTCFML